MGTTYLDLTNKLIRRINEVELTETSFLASTGIQALAKDCVVVAINEINMQRWEWPYQAYEHTIQLEIGRTEYSWPENYKSVDWESFEIQKDDVNVGNSSVLRQIDRDEWYKLWKDRDIDAGSGGVNLPTYVFNAHGNGFGVTPSPDKPYLLKFRYYKTPIELSAYDDVCDIPAQFDNVIITGALYHMNLFRENVQGVSISRQDFDNSIKNMYNILVKTTPPYVYDGRVNLGGGPFYGGLGGYHL